ncbi:MAG: type II toxin-antitoxin system RelE/ParE family toxin [Gammaproteobacteria bacterium]|jgi:hypothetical protein
MWEIEYTDEFELWWDTLDESTQDAIAVSVGILEKVGINLGFPRSSSVKNGKIAHLRELRIQHRGRPYRILYAFDPRRVCILLIGGDKTGNENWYEEYVPLAEQLYEIHINTLKHERLI